MGTSMLKPYKIFKKNSFICNCLWLTLILLTCSQVHAQKTSQELLNVSYDPTREFYTEINAIFTKTWHTKSGDTINIKQSHGGSGKQARAVIDGLGADVVTLALAQDIDEIAAKTGLLELDWQKSLPNNSSPYTSTIVFLVRKGNPKNIRDWSDLVRTDVQVITPNPKTSGGARWNYLAAWAYAAKAFDNNEAKITDFMRKLYRNVPVLDSGARGSTVTFVQREIGDVLLSWENEAHLSLKELGAGKVDIIMPSISVLAEPPVAVVKKNADKHNTTAVAQAYLEFLYTDIGQEIAAKHFYRPRSPQILEKYATTFANTKLVDIDYFGGWAAVTKKHFSEGAIFDQIFQQ